MNGGNGGSLTSYKSGFNIVKKVGCPELEDYYDPVLNHNSFSQNSLAMKYWMSDYEKYKNAMSNKVISIGNLYWDSTYESLNEIKHWISNHNTTTDSIGGLAIIQVYMGNGYKITNIPYGPEQNKKIIRSWASSGGHAMTIVGYNDSICAYDINGDGIFKMKILTIIMFLI